MSTILRSCGVVPAVIIALGLALLPARAQTGSSQWEREIHAYEASDLTNPPPKHAVLFIGSSAFRLWKSMARDFPGEQVIDRGFGGSEIHDSTAFANRIIFPYEPRMIVLYAGDNDLAAGMTPDQVVAEYKEFVRTVRERLPQTRIAFVSIKPSPSRWRLKNNIVAVNHEIAAIKGKQLVFINIFSPMLDSQGNPRRDLFRPDMLHPNEKGYDLWASVIRPFLDQ